MKTAKTSKRALLCSVLSIALCLSMLIGTTFAWFTDTATTAVNKIVSGKLEVDIVSTEAGNPTLQGTGLQFTSADGKTGEAILWEPGATYKTQGFKIKNNGNLALKFKVAINGTTGSSDLLKVITFSIVKSDGTVVDLNAFEGHLKPTAALSDTYYIQGHMAETAGNEYQEKTLDGVTITVYATQDTYEKDSKDDQYDVDAAYPADGLKIALAQGGNVTMSQNVTVDKEKTSIDDRLTITKPTTLTLSGTLTSSGELFNSDNFATMFVLADTTIDAGSTGGLSIDPAYDEDGPYGTYGINVKEGATLTVNGGNFYCGGTAIQVQKGTLIVNGGHFEVIPFSGSYGYNFLLNCIDSAYKNGTAKIIVKGGTFVNFDPSNNSAEGAGTNFVDPDYKVVSEPQSNGEIWYTVVAK